MSKKPQQPKHVEQYFATHPTVAWAYTCINRKCRHVTGERPKKVISCGSCRQLLASRYRNPREIVKAVDPDIVEAIDIAEVTE